MCSTFEYECKQNGNNNNESTIKKKQKLSLQVERIKYVLTNAAHSESLPPLNKFQSWKYSKRHTKQKILFVSRLTMAIHMKSTKNHNRIYMFVSSSSSFSLSSWLSPFASIALHSSGGGGAAICSTFASKLWIEHRWVACVCALLLSTLSYHP